MKKKKSVSSCCEELVWIRKGLFTEIDNEAHRLKICLLATFLFGLIAHAFGLLNLLIGHDSLHEFYLAASMEWKLTLGRFMEPLLRSVMGETITLPWLAGLTGFLCIGLSAHLLSKMFSLNKPWETLLLCGILVTNVTVTALIATYVHDFAGDMCSLLCSVAAAYFWSKMSTRFSWKYTTLGALCLLASAGFYQAYLAVAATVILLHAIQALLKGTSCVQVLRRLLRAIPMAVFGVTLYFVCVTATQWIFHAASSTGDPNNDLTMIDGFLHNFTDMAIRCYRRVISTLFLIRPESVKGVHAQSTLLVCLVNLLLLFSSAGIAIQKAKKSMKLPEILMTFALLLLLPLSASCISLVSTASHALVRYAYYLFYLLVLILFGCQQIKEGRQMAVIGLISVVLFSNIQIANTAYVKKDLEQQAALSTMTRIISRLEAHEDYVFNESEVAIIGNIDESHIPLALGPIVGITGLEYRSPITYCETVEDYFSIYLQYPIRITDSTKIDALQQTDAFQKMSTFPAPDSIATIDDVIVVKLP